MGPRRQAHRWHHPTRPANGNLENGWLAISVGMRLLRSLHYDTGGVGEMLATEESRPVEHSVSTFVTDQGVSWLGSARPDEAWFAQVSLR